MIQIIIPFSCVLSIYPNNFSTLNLFDLELCSWNQRFKDPKRKYLIFLSLKSHKRIRVFKVQGQKLKSILLTINRRGDAAFSFRMSERRLSTINYTDQMGVQNRSNTISRVNSNHSLSYHQNIGPVWYNSQINSNQSPCLVILRILSVRYVVESCLIVEICLYSIGNHTR